LVGLFGNFLSFQADVQYPLVKIIHGYCPCWLVRLGCLSCLVFWFCFSVCRATWLFACLLACLLAALVLIDLPACLLGACCVKLMYFFIRLD
jgi:hypothetical protein